MVATISSKGQLTIPLAIRNSLRLRTGDKADFSDYLIGERALAAGARTTLSFDEDACSCDLFESV